MGDIFTVSAALDTADTGVATIPQNVGDPYVYWLKAANAGTVAQIFQFRQNRHNRTFTDRSVVPASAQPRGDIGTPSDTIGFGGDPERDRLLTLNPGGTINLAANPDGTLQGGSIHVTIGFNL